MGKVDPSVLTRVELTNIVGELIGLPPKARDGKAYKVVDTIINTLANALKNGEQVRISGFGTFKIVPGKRTAPINYIIPAKGSVIFQKRDKSKPWVLQAARPRKTVKFLPCYDLRFDHE